MTSKTHLLGFATLALAAGCSREPPPAPKTGLGNVMVQVARRFELAGRAAAANRFELAEFEAGEIQETFENDVPGAELPKEGPTAQILPLAKAFLETNAKELHDAAAKKDRAAFDAAFQTAAAACNTCHEASAKAFIHVPSEPGKPVPDVEPVPASSARSAPSP
jgi:cytochrome c553